MFSLLRPPKKCFKCETIKSHHFEEAGKKKNLPRTVFQIRRCACFKLCAHRRKEKSVSILTSICPTKPNKSDSFVLSYDKTP